MRITTSFEDVRIIEMVNKGKVLSFFVNFSQLFYQGNVWSSHWKICV